MKKASHAVQTAVVLGGKVGARMFTALSILMEVQTIKFNSPSAVEHRMELRRAGSELMEALQDWRKFVEVLSSVGDKLNFAPSELGMISRVNRLLLDSVERLSGQGGRLVLLIFIAIWKATYVVLRSVIQLLVAALRAVMTISKQIGKMVADYLHSQIQALTATSETSSFFGTAVNAPPSIRKTVLYLLSGALLIGAPVLILTKYVLPAVLLLLNWIWKAVYFIPSKL